jgi:elongator complex protein 1
MPSFFTISDLSSKQGSVGQRKYSAAIYTDIFEAYEFLQDYEAALQSYRQAVSWREALSCAETLRWPQEKVKSLANELADLLEESKEYTSAATIHLEYIENIEAATKLLCRACQFAEASRITIYHKRPDLLESAIEPGLLECFNTTTELIADCKAQIKAQVPRLRELRIKKEQEPCK